MTSAFFVTGTETDVGKTLVAAGLLHRARTLGLSAVAIKPVAAGCRWQEGQWQNDDALQLQQAASVPLSYSQVNPVALEPAVAPHIAARDVAVILRAAELADHCRMVMDSSGADVAVIEGAGGWRVPLNDTETVADIARHLRVPVLLVVAMRLGCINHALLAAEAIAGDGLQLCGWIANSVNPRMDRYAENLAALENRIPAPLLGEIPFQGAGAAPAAIAAHLRLPGEVIATAGVGFVPTRSVSG